jgi:hypothetical protein
LTVDNTTLHAQDVPLARIQPEMFDGCELISKPDLKDFGSLLDVARSVTGLNAVVAPKVRHPLMCS